MPWTDLLAEEKQKPYFKELWQRVEQARQQR
ncbi:MAG: uracil-DNA glycosylase, partial [Idiomarina sp.]|nr:uracil-DNA glycosylase [Idiomarina sp.]